MNWIGIRAVYRGIEAKVKISIEIRELRVSSCGMTSSLLGAPCVLCARNFGQFPPSDFLRAKSAKNAKRVGLFPLVVKTRMINLQSGNP